MSRNKLLLRLLLRAAWVRKERAFTVLISVAVAATIATAALTVYYDLENKLTREFRSFGANIVVTAQNRALTKTELSSLNAVIGGHDALVPVAYAIATGPNNTRVVIGGANLQALAKLNSWWSLSNYVSARLLIPGEKIPLANALIGSRAAQLYSPFGEQFELSFANNKIQVRPEAVFTSGSEDDSRIYLGLSDFIALTGTAPNTAFIRVDGGPDRINGRLAQLTSALPHAEIRPLRQITQAQTTVLGKTKSVVLAASLVVMVLIVLCMASTFSGSVLERRRDFAVMKALGASNTAVNALFAAESALLGIAGAVAGYLLGCGVAFWIGKANFNAAILPSAWLFFPVLLGSILLALLASTVPLRALQQLQPAGILRGE